MDIDTSVTAKVDHDQHCKTIDNNNNEYRTVNRYRNSEKKEYKYQIHKSKNNKNSSSNNKSTSNNKPTSNNHSRNIPSNNKLTSNDHGRNTPSNNKLTSNDHSRNIPSNNKPSSNDHGRNTSSNNKLTSNDYSRNTPSNNKPTSDNINSNSSSRNTPSSNVNSVHNRNRNNREYRQSNNDKRNDNNRMNKNKYDHHRGNKGRTNNNIPNDIIPNNVQVIFKEDNILLDGQRTCTTISTTSTTIINSNIVEIVDDDVGNIVKHAINTEDNNGDGVPIDDNMTMEDNISLKDNMLIGSLTSSNSIKRILNSLDRQHVTQQHNEFMEWYQCYNCILRFLYNTYALDLGFQYGDFVKAAYQCTATEYNPQTRSYAKPLMHLF